jgi:hypothetical protein
VMDGRPVEARMDEKGEIRFYDENGQRVGRIHPRRWKFITAWIILVFFAIRGNRVAISNVSHTKASVHSLEQTNCALRQFLFSAYTARHKQALDDVNPTRRKIDEATAVGYKKLYELFPPDNCSKAIEQKAKHKH